MISTLRNTKTTSDPDAERGLLCCVCRSTDTLVDAIEGKVAATWFTKNLHQRIWQKIEELEEKSTETLDLDVMLEFEEGERGQVQQILGSCDTPVQFSSFFARVRDCWKRREILKLSMKLGEAVGSEEFESAEQILEVADREVTALTVEDEVTLESAQVVVRNTWENILSRQGTGGLYGIPSGIPRLDNLTCGWHSGDLALIAARTSVGKTAFSIELALAALRKGRKVLYFSLEMTNDQVMERMLMNESQVPLRFVIDKTCTTEQEKRFSDARSWLGSAPLTMDDDGSITVSGIRAKARKVARKGLDMVVIDYAQLIKPEDPKMRREQQVANVSKSIKALAKELKIPVIMLAQLNRTADEKNRKPRLSDLRESGALEQDADVVMMLWRKDDDPEQTKISITKQRQGRCGDVEVQFKTSIQRFVPAPILN